jgi:hypothetical protein
VVLPDGRACRGHDEDLDGIPDECDDCPGLPNPEQTLGAQKIGNACRALASGDLPYDRATSRLFFDPFTSYDVRWSSLVGGVGVFGLDDTGDRMSGGTASDITQPVNYLLTTNASYDTTTVVTTVLDQGKGLDTKQTSGIVLRAIGDPKRAFYCFRGMVSTHALWFGVAVGTDTCGDIKSPACHAQLAPSELPGSDGNATTAAIGLRASITTGLGPTTGTFECRIFDPTIPHSVHSADPRYVVSVPIEAADWIQMGAIGLAAQRMNTRFRWIEVFVDPTEP